MAAILSGASCQTITHVYCKYFLRFGILRRDISVVCWYCLDDKCRISVEFITNCYSCRLDLVFLSLLPAPVPYAVPVHNGDFMLDFLIRFMFSFLFFVYLLCVICKMYFTSSTTIWAILRMSEMWHKYNSLICRFYRKKLKPRAAGPIY